MKFIVGILAAAVLMACGVGYDDPEGQAAAGGYVTGSTSQSLTGDPNAQPQTQAQTAQTADPAAIPTAVGANTVGGGGGGTVSAPQDPIPALEHRKNGIDPANPLAGNAARAESSSTGR